MIYILVHVYVNAQECILIFKCSACSVSVTFTSCTLLKFIVGSVCGTVTIKQNVSTSPTTIILIILVIVTSGMLVVAIISIVCLIERYESLLLLLLLLLFCLPKPNGLLLEM